MEYKIVEREPFLIIGKEQPFNLADANASTKIKNFWETAFKEKIFEQIPAIRQPMNMLGVYTNYDKNGNYSLVLACPVTSLDKEPVGMKGYKISATKYAVFSVSGQEQQAIARFWQKLWEEKDTLGFERAFSADFESYSASSAVVEVYIAIKRG